LRTPLHFAAGNEKRDLIRCLLQHNAAIDSYDKNGFAPIHVAASVGNEIICTQLLGQHAEVNQLDKHGATCLHIAATFDHMKVTEVLLIHKAEVDIRDKDLQTPLHKAAAEGFAATCAQLLWARAYPDMADAAGKSPLARALEKEDKKHGAAARVLITHGASVLPGQDKTFAACLKGEAVMLHGLTSQELNLKKGSVVASGENGRIGIEVEGIGRKSIKPCNVAMLDAPCCLGDRILAIGSGDEDWHGCVGKVVRFDGGEKCIVEFEAGASNAPLPRSNLRPFVGLPSELASAVEAAPEVDGEGGCDGG